MYAVALLTSALLALADARFYERCELARDLLSLGIKKEHLATWVCIAFHESRFDTAARNPYSGDHGLLQISELYWCGAGKACGLPCSALRDDDIEDDVECALRVHEEHTRLQGNGFLAWVVYPQHCKHNAKKYLADCESSVKTPSVRPDGRARILKSQNRNVTTFSYNPKIDELLPPYLTVGSFLRGSYEKEFEQNYNKNIRVDWLNYKIDNVDDLKLPVFNQKIGEDYTTKPTSTLSPVLNVIPPSLRKAINPIITTTLSPLPHIKPPSPRRIESNSFRRRKLRPLGDSDDITPKAMSTLMRSVTSDMPKNKYSSILVDAQQSVTATVEAFTTPLKPSTKFLELSFPPPVNYLTNLAQNESFPDIKINTSVSTYSLSINKTPSFTAEKSHSSEWNTTQSPTPKSLLSWTTTPSLKTTITSTTFKPPSTSWRTVKSWLTPTQSYKTILSSTTSNPSSLPKSWLSTTPSYETTILLNTPKPEYISQNTLNRWSSIASSYTKTGTLWNTENPKIYLTSSYKTTDTPKTSKPPAITLKTANKTTDRSTTAKPPVMSRRTANPWSTLTLSYKTTDRPTTSKPSTISWRTAIPWSTLTSSYKTTDRPTTSKPSTISWRTANPWSSPTSSYKTTDRSTTAKPSTISWRTANPWSSPTSSYKTTDRSTTSKPSTISWRTANPWSSPTSSYKTTDRPTTSKPSTISWRTANPWSSPTSSYKTTDRSTTAKPPKVSWRTVKSWKSTPSHDPVMTTTSKPSINWWSTKSWSSTVNQSNERKSTTRTTNQTSSSNKWIGQSNINTSTTKTALVTSTTKKPRPTIDRRNTRFTTNSYTTLPKNTTTLLISTDEPQTTAKATQSIFDLYLNPKKTSNFTALSNPVLKNRGYSFRIFADGTTHSPSLLKSGLLVRLKGKQ